MVIKYLCSHYIFPFGSVPPGSPVVIYGMGKIGNEYINQLRATNYAIIKYAVDKDFKKYNDSGIEIFSPEKLKDENEAIIILAMASLRDKRLIQKTLIKYGISKDRIVSEERKYAVISSIKPVIEYRNFTVHEFLNSIKVNSTEIYTGTECLEFMKNIYKLLQIKAVCNKELIRVGGEFDGGYIMINDFLKHGIAYSFGISNDVSWDSDMANKEIDVFMYDHTISELPFSRDRFHYFKLGIADSPNCGNELRTLESLMAANGHHNQRHMVLKMDVEGAEWGFIDMVHPNTLERFDQLILEFHGTFRHENLKRVTECLEKLNKTHQVVHVHANNAGDVDYIDDVAFPDAIEVTYANRKTYHFYEAEIKLPIVIDNPNIPLFPEVNLNALNKK